MQYVYATKTQALKSIKFQRGGGGPYFKYRSLLKGSEQAGKTHCIFLACPLSFFDRLAALRHVCGRRNGGMGDVR